MSDYTGFLKPSKTREDDGAEIWLIEIPGLDLTTQFRYGRENALEMVEDAVRVLLTDDENKRLKLSFFDTGGDSASFTVGDSSGVLDALRRRRIQDEGLVRFWVSWVSGYYENEGCTEPPFQVWISGQSMGRKAKALDGQLSLDFFAAPKPPPEEPDNTPGDVSEAAEPKQPPKEEKPFEMPPGVSLDMDPLDYLRHVVKDREHMIFLCGGNPHICYVRTHSPRDPGKNWWVDRKKAEDVLRGEYYFHSTHVKKGENGLDLRSKVYVRIG